MNEKTSYRDSDRIKFSSLNFFQIIHPPKNPAYIIAAIMQAVADPVFPYGAT